MLRIVRKGRGWFVMRDGVVITDATVATHPSEDAAVRHVIRLAAETDEHVEPRIWTRHHSNGWLAQVSLNEEGGLGWQAIAPRTGGGELTPALDIQEAREFADAAVRQSGHECSRKCGSW